MDSLRKFLESTWFISLFHVLLFAVIIANMIYTERLYYCNQANKSLSFENELIAQKIERLESQDAYENSFSYQEKELRQRNYKLKGEEVIDTSAVEGLPENPEETYFPDLELSEKDNLESWIDLFQPNGSIHSQYASCGSI